MLPLSPFLLLLIASSLLAVCRAYTFEAAGSIACPTQAARNFSTDCASDCLHHPSCNGFTWNPNDRSCTLAFNLPPPASTGACKLYLRPNIKALRQRCPNFDIHLPSSPDRLFALLPRRESVSLYESSCRSIGGVPADLHQGDSVRELVDLLVSQHFQEQSWFGKCSHFSSTNIQCKISIGADTINRTSIHWRASGVALDTTVFNNRIVSDVYICPTALSLALNMRVGKILNHFQLKCDDFSKRFPLCHCPSL